MIIFSDLHLREETADVVFGQVLPGIQAAALERRDFNVVCLGDWWHVRHKVPVTLLNKVHEVLSRWAAIGISVRLLPGNHDQVDLAGENALQVFRDIDGVQVYSVPTHDPDGFWIPYRKDPSEIAQALSGDQSKQGTTLFLHHGVQGALMNDAQADVEGLPIGMFQGYGTILCGHYHKRQNVGRSLFYIGSPYQTNAGEAGQDKGFAVWDGKRLEYVTTQWGKRYHLLTAEMGKSLDLAQVRPGDEVRVVARAGVRAEIVHASLAGLGVDSVVTEEVETPAARLAVAANASLSEFARAYVAQRVDEDEGDQLMRMFAEISGVTL